MPQHGFLYRKMVTIKKTAAKFAMWILLAHIVDYLVAGKIPLDWSSHNKKKNLVEIGNCYWDDPYSLNTTPTK